MTVDVNEGRRLYEASRIPEGRSGVVNTMAADTFADWLDENASALLDAVEKVEAVERALHDAPYLLARERLSKIAAILDGSGVPE